MDRAAQWMKRMTYAAGWLLLIGVLHQSFGAGLPDQDATPAALARYQFHDRVSSLTIVVSLLLLLLTTMARLMFRRFSK